MNEFEYVIVIEEIDNLTTKKSKKGMLTKLITPTYRNRQIWTYHLFKAVTYLIKKYPKDLIIGTSISDHIKGGLLLLLDLHKDNIDELTEFCDSQFTVTENHFERLANSRYTTFQMMAYIAKNVRTK